MTFDPVAFFTDQQKTLVGGQWTLKGTELQFSSYFASQGLTIDGVELLGTADVYVPDARVMLQIQLTSGPGALRPLHRIEWRPIRGHTNKKNGPRRLHYKSMPSSHVHRFEDNWVALEQRMLLENLPVADTLPMEPLNFSDLVAIAASEFRIANMTLPVPPWEPLLRMSE